MKTALAILVLALAPRIATASTPAKKPTTQIAPAPATVTVPAILAAPAGTTSTSVTITPPPTPPSTPATPPPIKITISGDAEAAALGARVADALKGLPAEVSVALPGWSSRHPTATAWLIGVGAVLGAGASAVPAALELERRISGR